MTDHFNSLRDAEKKLLARLSIFAGGWTLDTAEAVCAERLGFDLRAGLKMLIDNDLIGQVQGMHGETRLVMPEAIYALAAEQLRQSAEWDALESQHVEHFTFIAEKADSHLSGGKGEEWLIRLDDDHANLRAALNRALAAGRVGMAMRLSRALLGYWRARDLAGEAREVLAAIIAQVNGLPQEWQARAHEYYAEFCIALSDLPAARAACDRGLEIVRQIYEPHDLGNLLYLRGRIALEQGERAQAKKAFEECAQARRAIGDQRGLAAALNSLAAIR